MLLIFVLYKRYYDFLYYFKRKIFLAADGNSSIFKFLSYASYILIML